ncbi:arginyl-tRNA synthetase [Streptomyces sp. Amel2xB2]|uniref:DALR anticodon-binding domain-containing protein n=1 Tax=Streptomyces sp. Amel2xB2 TaxID=1305829 RepID=UPI000DBA09D1|nr:DALR anticodon-binding domain-containing protein [Streptomyces sp. Amel2xB2]RAJ71192.1 arginyl-tRNA synthetase [Streptomyces sp. Amel2xB2]
MTPAQLSRTVLRAARSAVADGELGRTRGSVELPQRVTVESPPRRGGGDYAVSVAFRLAGPAGMTPYDVARVLRDRLVAQDGVGGVEIAGGGFLNVTLDDRGRADLVAELSREDEASRFAAAGTPAADIAHWSAATGDAPAALTVRTAQASPLFRVQYAHARARALSRNARDLGFRAEPYAQPYAPPCTEPPAATRTATRPGTAAGTEAPPSAAPARTRSPYGPRGDALLALLADHRRVSEESGPSRHARHLLAVSDAFFDFQEQCPPLPSGDEKPGAAHRARLALAEATGTVLAGGLALLGVSAPVHI